jgi:hypothetical protein
MVLTAQTQRSLSRLQELVMLSEDEVVQRGITQAATDRIIELRLRASHLAGKYHSIEALETRVRRDVSVDDHTLYTDLLEWRAAQVELEQLANFLEAA